MDKTVQHAVDVPPREMWQTPEFRRIGADEAQTGVNNGPEILILLS